MKVFNRLVPEEINRWERLLGELGDYVSHSQLALSTVDLKR